MLIEGLFMRLKLSLEFEAGPIYIGKLNGRIGDDAIVALAKSRSLSFTIDSTELKDMKLIGSAVAKHLAELLKDPAAKGGAFVDGSAFERLLTPEKTGDENFVRAYAHATWVRALTAERGRKCLLVLTGGEHAFLVMGEPQKT